MDMIMWRIGVRQVSSHRSPAAGIDPGKRCHANQRAHATAHATAAFNTRRLPRAVVRHRIAPLDRAGRCCVHSRRRPPSCKKRTAPRNPCVPRGIHTSATERPQGKGIPCLQGRRLSSAPERLNSPSTSTWATVHSSSGTAYAGCPGHERRADCCAPMCQPQRSQEHGLACEHHQSNLRRPALV